MDSVGATSETSVLCNLYHTLPGCGMTILELPVKKVGDFKYSLPHTRHISYYQFDWDSVICAAGC